MPICTKCDGRNMCEIGKASSMEIASLKWNSYINSILSPSNPDLLLFTEADYERFIKDSVREQEKVKSLLIEGVIDREKIRDKEQFVRINQALLIRLLNKLHAYNQTENLPKPAH